MPIITNFLSNHMARNWLCSHGYEYIGDIKKNLASVWGGDRDEQRIEAFILINNFSVAKRNI